jgi:hypothetical protein
MSLRIGSYGGETQSPSFHSTGTKGILPESFLSIARGISHATQAFFTQHVTHVSRGSSGTADSISYFDTEEVFRQLCTKHGVDYINDALSYLMENDLRFSNSNPSLFNFDQEKAMQIFQQIKQEFTLEPTISKTEKIASSSLSSSSTEDDSLSTMDVDEEEADADDFDDDDPSPAMPNFMLRIKENLLAVTSPKITAIATAEAPVDHTKEYRKLGNSLVGLVSRMPVARNYGKHQQIQIAFHVDPHDDRIILNTTLSSELQKKVKVDSLANHAFIMRVKPNGDSDVLLSRSGRCDSDSKIRAKSRAHIFACLGSTTFKNLIPFKVNSYLAGYTFQGIDFSFMDEDLLKSLGVTVQAVLKRKAIEDERKYLAERRSAIEETWNSADVKKDERGRAYIEHKFSIAKEMEQEEENEESVTAPQEPVLINEEHVIREYQPLAVNYVFSGQAKDPNNVKAARLANSKSYLEMTAQLLRILEGKNERQLRSARSKKGEGQAEYEGLQKIKQTLEEASNACDFCLMTTSPEHSAAEVTVEYKKKLVRALKDIAAHQTGETLPALKMHLAIRGLIILISGEDVNGESYDTEKRVAALYMFTILLAEVLNLAIMIACKSGNDRTTLGLALRCAMAHYEDVMGRPFDPSCIEGETFNAFCDWFVDAVIHFGRANLLAARGKPDLKALKSYPFKMYASFNPESKEPKWRSELLGEVNIIR